MTEEEWLACREPQPLLDLDIPQGRAYGRKLRLWTCACVRRAWHLLDSPFSREAIQTAERLADGQADASAVDAAEWSANEVASLGTLARRQGQSDLPLWVARDVARAAASALREPPAVGARLAAEALVEMGEGSLESQLQLNADLLRHIVGKPFRPYPVPSSWTAAVVQLAEAMYAGADCSFALHDALLEAGHPELAEHFLAKDHPKGCWVVDLLLSKE